MGINIVFPKFKEYGPINPKRFLWVLEKFFELKRIPDNYKFTVFMQALEGESVHWIESIMTSGESHDEAKERKIRKKGKGAKDVEWKKDFAVSLAEQVKEFMKRKKKASEDVYSRMKLLAKAIMQRLTEMVGEPLASGKDRERLVGLMEVSSNRLVIWVDSIVKCVKSLSQDDVLPEGSEVDGDKGEIGAKERDGEILNKIIGKCSYRFKNGLIFKINPKARKGWVLSLCRSDAENKLTVKLMYAYDGPYEVIEVGNKNFYYVRKVEGGLTRVFNLYNLVPYYKRE